MTRVSSITLAITQELLQALHHWLKLETENQTIHVIIRTLANLERFMFAYLNITIDLYLYL